MGLTGQPADAAAAVPNRLGLGGGGGGGEVWDDELLPPPQAMRKTEQMSNSARLPEMINRMHKNLI